MDFDKILEMFESAAKVMHMDKSHDAIRQKLQEHIAAQHRKDNASSDSSSYYNTPYVRDVFGSETEGHVVHSKDGKMTMSKFKSDGKGGYSMTDHKPVKHAYVIDSQDKKESLTVFIDGAATELTEAVKAVELSEILDLQEADAKAATAKITLITAGKGSSGYYTESALKKAAKDGIFAKGTQMFLNHQTREERLARPEGDITKLAGVLTSNAEYVEGTGNQAGKLVASAKIYPEYSTFIAARRNDIGLSVRVGAENSGKMQDGVPLVENMVYGLSTDFVTKAGRGGKIEELYESFRANLNDPGRVTSGTPPQESEMTNEELAAILKPLQESITGLRADLAKKDAVIDRLVEDATNNNAARIVSESLAGSGLTPRGMDRVRKMVMAVVPMKDNKLDVVALQESVKLAIVDEKGYLQEAGVNVNTTVRFMGGNGVKTHDEAGKTLPEDKILEEAAKVTDAAINSILGKETK